MPKYLIMYDYGYGEDRDVIEAETLEEAENAAHDCWEEGAASQASYSAELLTQENAEEHGFEEEFEDD